MSESEVDRGEASSESALDLQHQILERELDGYDYAIFRALNENGRMSDTEIAERVGLSRTAVRRRRKKLTKDGVFEILAVIVLQEMELAYADVQIVVDRSAADDERDELINGLVDADLVYSLDSCMGNYDLFARAWHDSLNDLQNYLWDLLEELPAVESYTITPVVSTWKAWDKELQRPKDS